MSRTWFRYGIGVGGVVVALLATAHGQAPAPAPASGWKYVAPPAGQPDLQGVWMVVNTAKYDVEAHGPRPGIPAGPGVIVDPPGGKIPYQQSALAQREENYKNSRNPDPWKSADPFHKCYSPGVPRMTYLGWPFQIVQTDKAVVFVYEWMHQRRMAYYDVKARANAADSWNGDSRAHWDGKTLVVDVANQNRRTWFDMVGNFHSEALHVTERYTMIDPDTLDYEVTLEDPKVYTRPWKMKMTIQRQKNVPLLEYECQALLDEAGIDITWPRDEVEIEP
jgi:hypothetical protein